MTNLYSSLWISMKLRRIVVKLIAYDIVSVYTNSCAIKPPDEWSISFNAKNLIEYLLQRLNTLNIVDETVIGTTKLRNDYWCTIESSFYSIAIGIGIGLFSIAPYSYYFSNFSIALPNFWYQFCRLIRGFFSVLLSLCQLLR